MKNAQLKVRQFVNDNACRDFSAQTAMNQLNGTSVDRARKICWGATRFTSFGGRYKDVEKALRFYVTGLKHTGHVYIFLAANDTYTVVLTTTHCNEVTRKTDIYCDVLNETIDHMIEHQENYAF